MAKGSPRKKRTAQEQVSGITYASEPTKKIRRGQPQEEAEGHESSAIEDEDSTAIGPSLSIQAIKRKVEDIVSRKGGEELERYMIELESDTRVGVIALVANVRESVLRQIIESQRLETMMSYEKAAFQAHEKLNQSQQAILSKDRKNSKSKATSQHYLIGVDEVGVGPLAGPIVSCAVAFHYSTLIEILDSIVGIDDSKKLSAIKRESLAQIVKESCITFNYGIVTAKEVDELNPLQGSLIAMKRAVNGIQVPPQSFDRSPSIDVLVDHHTIPDLDDSKIRQMSITKGDSKSIVIAAASILAKVYRDEYMTRLHQEYPHFAFDRNAGYGTKDHLDQLKKGILCPEHRLTFEPVRLAHRVSMGLPPDSSPKKKTRAKSRSVSPTKMVVSRSKLTIGDASTVKTPEANLALPPVSIFSLSWWSRLFSTSPSIEQR